MGNEMGNNNTSAIKEEDNISEGEKNNLLEDRSELANGVSQDVHAEGVKEENENVPTSITKDVMEKATKASNDLASEHGKDSQQENGHADDVEGKIQTIPTAEAKDVQEKTILFASDNTSSMLENDSLEGDTHASDVNMQNQMHPIAEAEDVHEKATGLASEDTETENGKVTLQEDSHTDDVKEKIEMISTAEAKDVQEKATGLISNNTESMLENDSMEGDTHVSDINMENQMHPTAEVEDVQEKTTGMTSESDYTRSSLENDLSKGDIHEVDVDVDYQRTEGKDDQEIAAKLGYDDKTSELEDKTKEDKQDVNVVIPIANDTDAQGETTILASDDPLNLRNSFGDAGEERIEVRQPEISPYAGSVEAEGENSESLTSSSLEGTEENGMQEDSCLRKHLSVTCSHQLNDKPSIKQDEEETMVLTLNTVNTSSDSISELQESPNVHSDHDELVKCISGPSLQAKESLLKVNVLDANPHSQQIKDDVSEKDMESQEKMLCANKSDGNGLGNGLIDTLETTSDPPSNGNSSNSNLLTKVNYTTEDSLNSFPESSVVDNPLKSDHEENCKVLHEESRLSRSRSTMENPHDYKPDQCMKDSLKEYKSGMVNTYDVTIESNGDCNGEGHVVIDSTVFGIANSDQVEEPKVTENGLQFDAYVNNSNKASDESTAASEEKHSMVPEAEMVFLTAGSTVVDCIHDKRENHENKIEDPAEKPEASYAMVKTFEEKEVSEQCNSDLGNVEQTKSFTATSMPNSDWKQTNDSKYSGATVDKLDSSKLTVPSLELVDEEESEKVGGDDPKHAEAEATSLTDKKSPSFNLNLRIQARPEESDQTPLLCQDKSANESLSNKTILNHSKSMPHAEYEHCMLHSVEMPAEEKIVTMVRSYSMKSKAPFKGLLREKEEEAHLLVMPQTQDNNAGTKKAVKEVSSSSPEGREKRKSRSFFFSSCMCCATVEY
ncbi:hypothetical protein SESBI_07097 [Sesbania bispinosa]|nr:hypothetical protein SESBI_07097 [Sesbania bispinosa]